MVNFSQVLRNIVAKPSYAAGADPSDYEWFSLRGFDRVVTRKAASDYKREEDAYLRSPSALPEPPSHPPPAYMSAVVRLPNYGFHLDDPETWDPATSSFPLAKTRASASVEDPGLQELRGHFERVFLFVGTMLQRALQGDEERRIRAMGVINSRNENTFKVSHRVFKRRKARRTQNADHPTVPNNEMEVDDWPCAHAAAQPHFNNLKATHVAKPPQAFSANNRRIQPARYRTELSGALVRLEFALNHHRINGTDYFTADIAAIRVLSPPLPIDTLIPDQIANAESDPFSETEGDVDDRHVAVPTTSPPKRARGWLGGLMPSL